MMFARYFVKAKALYAKYENRITPAAFFVGFIVDNLTLRRIDLWFQNAIWIAYLALAAGSIAFINIHDAKRFGGQRTEKCARFMPYVMQFVFGGLFSAFLVFYSRSSSFLASWPFLLFLAALFIGNEILKKHYARFAFHTSVFFIALFSYSVFALPVLFGKMGASIFVLSGIAALATTGILLYALYRIAPEKLKKNRHPLILSIGSIYLLFHIFYFTDIIPPIPLALKESGIYHSLERVSIGGYIYKVASEPSKRYILFKRHSGIFHWIPGEKIYSYSAVFAPTKLDTTILHRWSYFNKEKNGWIEMSRLSFSVIGGRDGGYRGYTFKQDIRPGKWRVDVITQDGKVLGRRTFKVVAATAPVELKTDFR